MFCQMSSTSLGYQDKKLPTCNAGDEVLEGRAWCQTPSDHTREQSFQTSDFRQLAGHRGILACCEQCDNAGWCWSIVLWLDRFHIWNQRANLMIKFVNIQENPTFSISISSYVKCFLRDIFRVWLTSGVILVSFGSWMQTKVYVMFTDPRFSDVVAEIQLTHETFVVSWRFTIVNSGV